MTPQVETTDNITDNTERIVFKFTDGTVLGIIRQWTGDDTYVDTQVDDIACVTLSDWKRWWELD